MHISPQTVHIYTQCSSTLAIMSQQAYLECYMSSVVLIFDEETPLFFLILYEAAQLYLLNIHNSSLVASKKKRKKKEFMTPVFYFPVAHRVHPWTSHLDADPERFSRLPLIPKTSLKVWALISLAFDFLSCKIKMLL